MVRVLRSAYAAEMGRLLRVVLARLVREGVMPWAQRALKGIQPPQNPIDAGWSCDC